MLKYVFGAYAGAALNRLDALEKSRPRCQVCHATPTGGSKFEPDLPSVEIPSWADLDAEYLCD